MGIVPHALLETSAPKEPHKSTTALPAIPVLQTLEYSERRISVQKEPTKMQRAKLHVSLALRAITVL